MKKYMLKIFGLFLLSICCSLVMLQQSSFVKQRVVDGLIELLEKEWSAKISVQDKFLNFFTTSIILADGIVTPNKQPNTLWGFKHAKISFGLFDALFKRKISLYLTLYNVHIKTATTSQSVEIVDHLADILSQKNAGLPVSIKKVFIRDAVAQVMHNEHAIDLQLHGSFTYGKVVKDGIKVRQGCILLDNSTISLNNQVLIDGISGSNIFYRPKTEEDWHITLHNTIKHLASSTPQNFILTGSWYQKDRTFFLQEADLLLNLKAITSDTNIHLEGTIPLQTAAHVYDIVRQPTSPLADTLSGQCSVDLIFDKHPTAAWLCRGLVAVDHPRFKNVHCEKISLKNLYINQEIASADAQASFNDTHAVQGTGCWYFGAQHGNISLANSTEIITARRPGSPVYWSIQPQGATLTLDIDRNFDIRGSYKALLNNSINAEIKDINGSIATQQSQFVIKGNVQKHAYSICGKFGENPHLVKISCTHSGEKEPILDFFAQDDLEKTLRGYVKYSLIQDLLPVEIKDKVLGKNNKIYLSLKQDKFSPLEGTLWTQDSRLFIPSVQNMIKDGSLDFCIDPATKKITANNVKIAFARGNISVPQASCEFDQETLSLQNLYVPISINNLLINPKRDFYSFVYGNLLLQQHPEKPLTLSGTLVLHKTLVRGDVFNDQQTSGDTNPLEQFQEFSNDLDFSIRLINEKPIIIKTPTIEALAHVDLHTNYKRHQTISQLPHVTGTINIDQGHLKFLENNLKIEYGKIQFLTRQLNDPVIDLIAKNRINKYVVTLQVTGSLQKPTVILESTPELSEEQILGLLFTGSENATLQTDLPVMIMQNLNTILLGHRKPYDKTSMLIDTLSKPFKYVQITPDLTDQSGRSGMRAQISVPLGKQLKAQFQKNLTFDEDLSVEIDYLLSDDINLKLVRDQRGELGSEVEVRFKF